MRRRRKSWRRFRSAEHRSLQRSMSRRVAFTVNLEDKSEVAVIDAAKHEVVAHWPLAPGEEPTGIALDAAHHRLFATCHNKMMEMLDTDSGKVLGHVPIGTGVDGCAFDEASQLAFASCGEGVTVIAKENSPNELSVVQTLPTQRGARTIALDPKTHRIYLPTADFQPRRRLRMCAQRLCRTRCACWFTDRSECAARRFFFAALLVFVSRFAFGAGRAANDHGRSGHAGQRKVGKQSGDRRSRMCLTSGRSMRRRSISTTAGAITFSSRSKAALRF